MTDIRQAEPGELTMVADRVVIDAGGVQVIIEKEYLPIDAGTVQLIAGIAAQAKYLAEYSSRRLRIEQLMQPADEEHSGVLCRAKEPAPPATPGFWAKFWSWLR